MSRPRYPVRLMAACGAVGLLFLADLVAAAPAREEWFLAARNHQETGLAILLIARDDGSRWMRVLDVAMLELDASQARRSSHAGEAIVPVQDVAAKLLLDRAGGRAHFFDAKAHRIDAEGTELLLDTLVNGQAVAEPQLFKLEAGELLIANETLRAAGATAAAAARPEGWVPLHSVAGESFIVDVPQMRVEITLPAAMFATTTIDAEPRRPTAQPSPAPLAAIFGYDANISGDSRGGDVASSLLIDAAVAARNVSCRSRHLWRNTRGTARLDSTCTIDWPERALSLAVGDGVTRAPPSSASVRYGGVRFGTDYALQPYLYTQPVLELESSARLPSVLEIWIDQQLALRQDLPPGPFLLDNLPLLTGRGEVEAVVVDAMGRRRVISESFYSDPVLLRPGLIDWAVEIGRLRTGNLESSRYTDPFALASWKRGIHERFTLDLRGEAREHAAVAGVSGYFNLGWLGVLELGLAGSTSREHDGWAQVLGYSFRGHRWSVGGRRLTRSRGYSDIAWPVPGTAPRRETTVGGGVRLGRASVSINAADRQAGDGSRQTLATAAVSLPAGRGYLTLAGTRLLEPVSDTTWLALYTLPLDQASVAARLGYEDGQLLPGVHYQRSPPLGPGIGYLASIERRPDGTAASADVLLRGGRGELDASFLHRRGTTSARVGAAGAVVVTGNGVFAAPDDGGSFALVSLPAPRARVLHDNQVVSVTDERGRALLTRVRAFEQNLIAVQVDDLPITTKISVPELEVVPGRRQVAVARFDAATVNYLAARLHRADGSPVPLGATAHLGESTFPVGHDGLVFAELSGPPTDVVVFFQGQRLCAIPKDRLPATTDGENVLALTCE